MYLAVSFKGSIRATGSFDRSIGAFGFRATSRPKYMPYEYKDP